MAGEVIKAKTLEEGLKQIRKIYQKKSDSFKVITKEDYEKIHKSEREDSDNHLNLERLGKDSDVVDLAFYKYLPNKQVAYRIELIHVDAKSTLEDFFIIAPKETL